MGCTYYVCLFAMNIPISHQRDIDTITCIIQSSNTNSELTGYIML